MAKCESCGEKPKCSSQDFTKTVVEIDNPERLVLLRKVIVPASMGDETEFPPAVGKYSNVILQYEATGTLYIYSSDGIPTKIESAIPQDILDRIATLETDMDAVELGLSSETDARERKDDELQQEIDDIKNSPDVVDIVATHADLLAYDTSKLGDNDVIRVLQDETHDGESTYYRWNKTTSQWAFIGSVGDYYTKTQVDDLLDGKQDVLTAGENITIEDESGALVISATGGSAVSQTIFYANLSETGATRHIYKEASFTTAVSAQEIIDANDEGQVILRGTSLANPTAYSDSYLQNAFIMPHNNDYEFVFLDRDLRHEYSVSSVSDTDFYYETSGIQTRLTEGANVQIQNNVISATDTTYSNFTGTDGTTAGTAGLVPAPATTDAGKYLKADGTWETVNAGPTVVQTTGTSQTDVMSQNAVTSMVFADPGTNGIVRIGSTKNCGSGSSAIGTDAQSFGIGACALGRNTKGNSGGSVAIGDNAQISHATNMQGVAIGDHAIISGSSKPGAIALGAYSGGNITAGGIVDFGSSSTSLGYNSSNYRLITGVYDGQSAHDAATYGQVISYSAINGAGAPTTATEGKYVGQLYYDTTNEAMYFLKTIDTTTTPATYTWEALGGGSSVNVVQATGTSTTDVMSQNAATRMVYKDADKKFVRIGADANVSNTETTSRAVAIHGSANYNGIAIGKSSSANAGNNYVGPVAIGFSASAQGSSNSVGLGYGSKATGQHSIAISPQANTSMTAGARGNYSIALGYGADAASVGEMNIGTVSNYGYNSSNYRIITGVYDGQSAHDAATKGQLDAIAIQNAGAPTTSTTGSVGQLLEDTTNGKLYQCTAVDTTDPQNPSYTWTEVGAGGGSGPTVVQTTGTSTTDVMSQKATTLMVYKASNRNQIQLGDGAQTNGSYDVAIGQSATSNSANGMAFGRNANVAGSSPNAIAFGAWSKAEGRGVISVNLTGIGAGGGYNSSNYRLLTGLYDPQSAHDAATKGYVDTAVAGAGTSAFTTNEWDALWA